jgi:hypothetical protein
MRFQAAGTLENASRSRTHIHYCRHAHGARVLPVRALKRSQLDERRHPRIDGRTLIQMCFQRRGGRKRIVAPDGSEIVPASKPQPDGTLVKPLARAWLGRSCSTPSFTLWRPSPRGGRGLASPKRAGFCDSRCWRPTSWRRSSRATGIRRPCWRSWSGGCRRAGRSSEWCSIDSARKVTHERCGVAHLRPTLATKKALAPLYMYRYQERCHYGWYTGPA